MGSWDCAVHSFGIAWRLSPRRCATLRATANNPTRRLDASVGELFGEASALALEVEQPALARWCYEFCGRVLTRAEGRPKWREIEPERHIVEGVTPPSVAALSAECLVWWCTGLLPGGADETPEMAQRRTAECALYLTIKVAQAFLAHGAASHERAGLLAALGVVIARRVRMARRAVPVIPGEVKAVECSSIPSQRKGGPIDDEP
jgi:hypothetical protein